MSHPSRNHLQALDAIGRRAFIRRAAAIGLGAAASSSILAACATGGGGSASAPASSSPALTTDPANPFGVQASAPLDVVIFNGGFGDAYAKFTEGLYSKKFADSAVSTPQPRTSVPCSHGSSPATHRTRSTTPARRRWTTPHSLRTGS